MNFMSDINEQQQTTYLGKGKLLEEEQESILLRDWRLKSL